MKYFRLEAEGTPVRTIAPLACYNQDQSKAEQSKHKLQTQKSVMVQRKGPSMDMRKVLSVDDKVKDKLQSCR